uniref:Plastid M48-like peptidase n=1 Tax=Karenia brevis TaxID=156230 RepID=Q00GM3_KARBR|nr:plastid M48-like peptidase precursor [Karenia brevis]
MHVSLIVACMACVRVGHGRRVQMPDGQLQSSLGPRAQTSPKAKGEGTFDPLGRVAMFLLALSSTAFNPSSPGASRSRLPVQTSALHKWSPAARQRCNHRLCSFPVMSVTQAASRELIGFPSLQARDFQHPRDKTATQQAALFMPIDFAFRQLFQRFEDAGFLQNVGRGVQVSAEQYPTIHRLTVEAAAQMDMPVPDVFVVQNSQPNAYTVAIQEKRPFVVLHTSLIDLMTLEEVKAVIGHELGHLKCEHGVYITVLNILSLGVDVVDMLIPLGLRDLIERQLTQWRRSAELSCDRAALLVTQDEDVVMGVLMKLTGGSSKLAGEMSAQEFARQAKDYDEVAKASMLGRMIKSMDENQLYPLPILRAREIQKYAGSKEYISLKNRLGTSVKV